MIFIMKVIQVYTNDTFELCNHKINYNFVSSIRSAISGLIKNESSKRIPAG